MDFRKIQGLSVDVNLKKKKNRTICRLELKTMQELSRAFRATDMDFYEL